MKMKTVLVTGSQGFIGSYICKELLDNGYIVVGVDNYAKYGKIKRDHDEHPNFHLILKDLTKSYPKITCDYIIACAASIGGIKYFHDHAYELIATNERILSNTFDFAIESNVDKIVYISSSMVYENCLHYPSKESHLQVCSMPQSTYGMQKLMGEFYCKGAYQQHGLKYSIVRPFNAVGIGEEDAILGNTHVLPDLVFKALSSKSDDILPIYGDGNQVRCYTHASDIARGVRLTMEYEGCEDFNISNPKATSVKQLATIVWNKIHNCDPVLKNLDPFSHDVTCRIPCVEKAKEVLGFKSEVSLEDSVDEVIYWMKGKIS